MEATGSCELYVKCKDWMNEAFGVMLMLKSDLGGLCVFVSLCWTPFPWQLNNRLTCDVEVDRDEFRLRGVTQGAVKGLTLAIIKIKPALKQIRVILSLG